MAFSDPQTLTVNAVAQTLARTGSGTGTGTFSTTDGLYQLSIQNFYGKRTRRSIRFTGSKVSADPLVPSQNVRSSMSVTLGVDMPVNGYTVTEAKQLVDALVAYLTASTGARVTQLLGGEN